jgi:protein SCO1/2
MSENLSPTGSNQRARLAMLAALGVLILGVGAVLFLLAGKSSPQANSSAAIIESTPFDGITTINPPRSVADFTLTGTDNQPFKLSALRGKPVLLFFGYTHCPDFCPTTLLTFKLVKKALGADGAKLHFMFISVDGERDTPSVVADYLTRFDSTIIGLTGDDAALNRLAPDFSLYFGKQPGSSKTDYLVDHTTSAFLLDREGRLVANYAFGLQADNMAADIQPRLQS